MWGVALMIRIVITKIPQAKMYGVLTQCQVLGYAAADYLM